MVNLILLQAKESFANDFGSVPNKKEGHPDISVQFFSRWFYFFGRENQTDVIASNRISCGPCSCHVEPA